MNVIPKRSLPSWGRFPPIASRQQSIAPACKKTLREYFRSDRYVLPRGRGRSYGDVCLNQDGTLILSTYFDHFLEFDPGSGLLRCQSGVTIREILDIFLPRGWTLPVLPGTAYVTVGGAIANDIHGKNHHRHGSFGMHVLEIVLSRSDSGLERCSRSHNDALFYATIGGLGLTGFITEAVLQLMPVRNGFLDTRCIPFSGFDEFLQLSQQPGEHFEYTVAWFDWHANHGTGRGIFFLGNHSLQSETETSLLQGRRQRQISIPFAGAVNLVRRPVMRVFNSVYFKKQIEKQVVSRMDFETFFFPLDRIRNWNLLYGRRGFLQWQAVVPEQGARYLFNLMKKTMAEADLEPALTVIKKFGDVQSGGLLSFPMAGITFALDFPAASRKLFAMLDTWDHAVVDLGGRLYPAKDSRMQPDIFLKSQPALDEFLRYKDRRISSSFWRRVTAGNGEG